MAIARITDIYTRRYSDNGQVTTYVEWIDGRGAWGRTECPAERSFDSLHMTALIARGMREGVPLRWEEW